MKIKISTVRHIIFGILATFTTSGALAVDSKDLSTTEIVRLFHASQDGSNLVNLQLNGGTGSIGLLLEQSGGSRSLGDITVFYSVTATAKRLREIISSFDERSKLEKDTDLKKFRSASEEAACAHAEDAYRRGLDYLEEESTRRGKQIKRIVAVGTASAFAYPDKKGEHRGHLCIISGEEYRHTVFSFPQEFVVRFLTQGSSSSPNPNAVGALRKLEEDQATRFVLAKLAEVFVPDFRYTDASKFDAVNPALVNFIISGESRGKVDSFGFTKRP